MSQDGTHAPFHGRPHPSRSADSQQQFDSVRPLVTPHLNYDRSSLVQAWFRGLAIANFGSGLKPCYHARPTTHRSPLACSDSRMTATKHLRRQKAAVDEQTVPFRSIGVFPSRAGRNSPVTFVEWPRDWITGWPDRTCRRVARESK